MRKNSSSESGAFNPRILFAFLLCSTGVLLAIYSWAATPPSGTISTATPTLNYTAGPFFQSNQSPVGLGQLDVGPRCDGAAFPCDTFALTVSLPAGYAAAHPFGGVKVTAKWTDSGAGKSDYDLYIYDVPRGDCSPNDCSSVDGTQQANHQSASGNDPEVATIFPLADGVTKHTIQIVPFQPTGETLQVKIELVEGVGSPSGSFGSADATTPGVPRYQNFYAPSGTSAEESSGEFNIGFNPKTGRIMTMNAGPVWRLTPPEKLTPAKPACCEALWEDKSTASANLGLDPILWTDQKTGRTFVSNSTAGANAVYGYSDNDGDSWTEGGVSPPNGGADHETIGSGPYPALLSALGTPVNQGQAVYYCSQDIVGPASCQRSDDLGASYGPGVLAYNGQGSGAPGGTDCGGLHGHLHVAPDGRVWLPVTHCGDKQGGATSTDGGATWTEFKVPGTIPQQQGADPSIALDADGTAYFAYVNNEPVAAGKLPEGHAHVMVSKDGGKTWTNDFDLGASHGIKNAVEIEAVGGSSGRAAIGFVGTDVPGPYQDDSFTGRWFIFISTTYDGGKTWVTVNATPNDPVQSMTGVWQAGGGRQDRNLLDFNEITVDDKGRVLYGYSDGCVTPGCIAGTAPNDFVAFMRVARQTGGKSLFASNDVNTDTTVAQVPKPSCLSGTRDPQGSHLSWKEPDNGGANIIKYQIFRGTTAGGESLTPIGQTVGKTTFLDATADPAVPHYFYYVKAINSAGFGAQSNEIDLPLGAVTPPVLPYSCSGVNVVTDAAGDAHNPAGGIGSADQGDITAVSFSLNPAKTALTTKMTLANLSNTPSPGTTSTIYFVAWTSSNGKSYATRVVQPDPAGTTYTYGEWDRAADAFVSGTTHSSTGTYNPGPNGTVTVDVPLSAVGNPTIPIPDPAGTAAVTLPYGIVFAGEGALGSGLYFTAPMDRAPNTGGGQKWAVCLPPNAAPTAALLANPDHGPAPLTVTFTGSGTDPDAGDTIASYTFDFGDGSNPVTQSSPTITHTYTAPGEYRARLDVTDSRGLISTNTAIAPIEVNAALRNISTRGLVQTDDNILIAGFIVSGPDPRQILLRGIGPSAKVNGQTVPGAMANPTIELHDSNKIIATNDDWKVDDQTGQSQQAAIQNTGAAPGDERESALVRTLNPGTYTVVLRGKGNTTGIALVEAFDLDPFANSKLANISTRGFVQTADNRMFAGFIAGPPTAAPTGILIRGMGPSLTGLVPNPLPNPTLELHDSNGTTLRTNDNWKDTQQAEIEATGIPPGNSAEAAILVDVAPGTYTAIMADKNGNSGIGLIEVYNIH
ncbi:MAG: hypothetical protein QOH88_3565 [Verrucomicrobiota bacterium]|jgi:PKD repeat protein